MIGIPSIMYSRCSQPTCIYIHYTIVYLPCLSRQFIKENIKIKAQNAQNCCICVIAKVLEGNGVRHHI